jgi:hypothetical protein
VTSRIENSQRIHVQLYASNYDQWKVLCVDDKELQKLRDLFTSANAKRPPSSLRKMVRGVTTRFGDYFHKKAVSKRVKPKDSRNDAA